MRFVVMGWLLLAADVVAAAGVEHRRGDFSFWVAPEPAFVERHVVPEAWPSGAPGADDRRWRYWLHDLQVDRRGGADAAYAEHVYEARATSLLGEAGRFEVSFNPGYQRLLFHRVEVRRGGSWLDRLAPDGISLARREEGFEQNLADGEVSALVVLDDVRIGDLVRISYTVIGSNPILQGQASDSIKLGWVNPQLDSYLRVLFDPGTEPAVHRENGAPEPVITRNADAVEVLLHAHAIPAIVNQDKYPPWYQPFPFAQVSARRSWADVVAWALPLYPAVDALPEDLEARLQEWKAMPGAHDRLAAVLRTVQDDVRYFGVEMGDNTHRPVAPGTTWERRYGDCKDKAYLLVTLLRRLGIEAAPALVSVHRGGALAAYSPTAAAFDHVIVRARVDDETVWVDPTMTQQGGDPRASIPLRYGVALPVAPGVEALEPIEAVAGPDNGITTKEHFVSLAEGDGVELHISTTYRGEAADNARRNLSGERTEDVSRRYADYYRKRYGELEVIQETGIEDDRKANVMVVSEKYRLESPFERAGAVRELEVYGESLQAISTLPSAVVRNGPLGFASWPAVYRHEVLVDVPSAWDAAHVDEELKHESQAFTYSRALDVGETGVKVVYEMKVDEVDVPFDATASHLKKLRQAGDSLSMRLRFHAPAPIEREERKQRLEALLRNAMPEVSP